MKIIVDAMGGDQAPSEIVKGAIDASIENDDLDLILIGDEKKIKKTLPKNKKLAKYKIHHSSQSVEMNDRPSQIVKQKPDSSIVSGLNLLKSKKAHAFVSAGSTGAILAASLLLLGRIDGVKRPALGVFFPVGEKGIVLCDAGANTEAKPAHLVQFSVMASKYMTQIRGIKNPLTGLLNIGEEETKGTESYIEGHKLMKKCIPSFIGNIESRYLFDGRAQIIVCDGFLGNNIVKIAEGWINHVNNDVSTKLIKNIQSIEEKNKIKSIFAEIMKDFDYEEYGGVPLLGVNGTVIKCHGRSSAKAIKNAILVAKKCVKENLINSIKNDISSTFSIIKELI
tara:strand:- start:56222 stop:57235 length:1014 start_codon:yes stop_codon:yes gene_type:complete